MINSVNTNQWVQTNQLTNTKQQTKTNQTAQTTEENTASSDMVEIGTTSLPSVVYSKKNSKKLGASDIEALKEQANRATENLRTLVEKLILKQGNLKNTKESCTNLYNDTVKQAEFAISEDGDFGIEAVSDRIVSFAIAIAGEDKTKLSELKAAIDKGFDQAGRAFGGKLPDICNQTYDAIMKKLDNWAKEDE